MKISVKISCCHGWKWFYNWINNFIKLSSVGLITLPMIVWPRGSQFTTNINTQPTTSHSENCCRKNARSKFLYQIAVSCKAANHNRAIVKLTNRHAFWDGMEKRKTGNGNGFPDLINIFVRNIRVEKVIAPLFLWKKVSDPLFFWKKKSSPPCRWSRPGYPVNFVPSLTCEILSTWKILSWPQKFCKIFVTPKF